MFFKNNKIFHLRLNTKRNPRLVWGVTLIETLIYAALISVIIGFSLLTTYQIIDSSENLNGKIDAEEEAGFLLKKIEWLIIGAENINSPLSGATNSVLSVNKFNFSNNPLVLDFDSNNLRLKRGAGGPVILNSQNIKIENLVFEHLAADGGKPVGIKSIFQIYGKSYEITVYLRK